MNKPKGKSYGNTSGAKSGAESGLSEASRFDATAHGPAINEGAGQRPKEVDGPSRKVQK